MVLPEPCNPDIKIIDGKTEAAIIASTDLHYLLKTEKTYLYVDVGGGSTEFSLFSNGKMIASKSFKAGTVRLLNEVVSDLGKDHLKQTLPILRGLRVKLEQ